MVMTVKCANLLEKVIYSKTGKCILYITKLITFIDFLYIFIHYIMKCIHLDEGSYLFLSFTIAKILTAVFLKFFKYCNCKMH